MRVISIAEQRPGQAGGAGADRLARQPALPLARREFLKGSGVLFGTLAAGTLLAGLAPSSAWALELHKLSTADGTTLMAMGRVLFPHPKLPDAVYALLVKDLDTKAGADAGTAKLLQDGIGWLDTSTGGSFAKASSTRKEETVRGMEGTAFFATVRGQCVTSLYDNEMAFAVFGYPGSAWEKGGYITRGFQDLKWLPAPSREASPPPYMG